MLEFAANKPSKRAAPTTLEQSERKKPKLEPASLHAAPPPALQTSQHTAQKTSDYSRKKSRNKKPGLLSFSSIHVIMLLD